MMEKAKERERGREKSNAYNNDQKLNTVNNFLAHFGTT